MRAALGLQKCMLFVDKFCVDQADSKRKEAGILGLAGFLECSEKLVVCWSPKYFTRLWCAYEIASWFFLQKPASVIIFRPLAQEVMTLLILLSVSLFCMSLDILRIGFPHLHTLSIRSCFGIAVVILFQRGVTQAIRSLVLLEEQLANFSIKQTKCYCCTHDHKNPDNGEVIPCDRKLVYATLREWQEPMCQSQDEALSFFDNYVQTSFATSVLDRASALRYPYTQLLFVTQPMSWRAADLLAAYGSMPLGDLAWWVASYLGLGFLILPGFYKLLFHVVAHADRLSGIPSNVFKDWLVSIGHMICGIVLLILMTSAPDVLAQKCATSTPVIAYYIGIAILDLSLFDGWRAVGCLYRKR